MMYVKSLILVLYINVSFVYSQCRNNCNKHGLCNIEGVCECYQGWSGSDCTKRTCPTGPSIADIAIATNTAHSIVSCSGRGRCNTESGLCQCSAGFTGPNCGRMECPNKCSSHGECVSLKHMATRNDGYAANRTTVYDSQWDADFIYGCICDFGFTGFDCSQRICPSGIDPRQHDLTEPREKITFVCDCPLSGCSGRFKLQYAGSPLNSWLTPSSTLSDFENVLNLIPGMTNVPLSVYAIPVNSTLSTANNDNSFICETGKIVKTYIYIKRNSLELPSLQMYVSMLSGASVYFETKYTLTCGCAGESCVGTFRLAYNGAITNEINITSSTYAIVTELQNLKTIESSEVKVLYTSNSTVCSNHFDSNFTFYLKSQISSLPRIRIFSSIYYNISNQIYFNQILQNNRYNKISYLNSNYFNHNTNNSLREQVLILRPDDGRSNTAIDRIKICNGVGKCDDVSGTCSCAYGYGPDPVLGPCGRLQVNSSKWGGLSRCPGVVKRYMNVGGADAENIQLNDLRIYVSFNPSNTSQNHREDLSYIASYIFDALSHYLWDPLAPTTSLVHEDTKETYMYLTSNSSAGSILIDHSQSQLFFVDQHPTTPFIARAPQYYDDTNQTLQSSLFWKWLELTGIVSGFAMDANIGIRRIYWSYSGSLLVPDGSIWYANMDENAPVPVSLTAAIGQNYLVDPMGLAVDFKNSGLVWVDRQLHSGGRKLCLRTCSMDGSNAKNLFVYHDLNDENSTELVDLVIDAFHNNTAYFVNSNSTGQGEVIATTLDFLTKNSTSLNFTKFPTFSENFGEYSAKMGDQNFTITHVRYLTVDVMHSLIMWCDTMSRQIKYFRYGNDFLDYENVYDPVGLVYTPPLYELETYTTFIPVGVALDDGHGKPRWGDYIDCYGNGVCQEADNSFICICNKGFYGDCQARTCPTGKAWFQEPFVNNMAHDFYVECSNMGICDRLRGTCVCNKGFEGSACERLSCPRNPITNEICSNSGICRTMSEMAAFHRDEYYMSAPIEYGTFPNSYETWDSDSIMGCIADTYGYTDLGKTYIPSPILDSTTSDEYQCLSGYNLKLTGGETNSSKFREVQTFTCNAQSGVFRMSFRGVNSQNVSFDSSILDFQYALGNIPSVGGILVSRPIGINETDPICTNGQSIYLNITFISIFGQLPLLQYESFGFKRNDYIQINRLVQSAMYGLSECSGHGDCITSTGACNCWSNYGPSNGVGEFGYIDDCGYQKP